MSDRNWKKPLKYSNKVFLGNDDSTKMQNLLKGKRSKSSIDNDEKDEESDESDEVSTESENKSLVGNEIIQVLNTTPLQPAPQQVQYVILSTGGPNGQIQLLPVPCSVLPNNQQSVFLSNNVNSAPTSSQISLAKVHQNNSINIKVNTNKSSTKTKKKKTNEKCDNSNKSTEQQSEISLTTTIERSDKGTSESTKKSATELNSILDSKLAENKEQGEKRNSVSEENSNEVNKKAKTGDSNQLTSPKNILGQQLVNPANSSVEKGKSLTGTTSPIVYQVDDDSNDSQLAIPTNGQSVTEKAAPTVNSTSNRCNYSTESLLQPQIESQSSSSQQNTSGTF